MNIRTRTPRILWVLLAAVLLMLACKVNMPKVQQQIDDTSACLQDGESYYYAGEFLPVDVGDSISRSTDVLYLHFNTKCTDAYAYGVYIFVNDSTAMGEIGYKITSTMRISFTGDYDITNRTFLGTAWCIYTPVCDAGDCPAVELEKVEFPANWTAAWDGSVITGWMDGYGDFRLDISRTLEPKSSYREINGLDMWPETP